jgi:hypothetical protein
MSRPAVVVTSATMSANEGIPIARFSRRWREVFNVAGETMSA